VEEIMHRFENKNIKAVVITGETKTARQTPKRTKIKRAPAKNQR
jgi:hypothetical protein